MDTLQICHDIIAASGGAPDGRQAVVPEIHFEDRDNYIYAMTASAEKLPSVETGFTRWHSR